jgi:hypothetical protein
MPNLLSEFDSERLNLIQRMYPVNVTNNPKDILNEYKHVFQGVGKLPGK